MSKPARPKVAICYDFDGTLAAGNMQEYDYFPQLGIKPRDFWKEAKDRAQAQEGDEILAYMCLMLEKAKADPAKGIRVTKNAFADYAKKVKLFRGVEEWFDRINSYGKAAGLAIEHYIISSGIREMIAGTTIAKQFKKIYASAYQYDQHGVAIWPILAMNYTNKTQFLFRVNKGRLDEWDNSGINAFTAKKDRPVPFERMIYIGDGSTDVPCMRLVKDQGGHSIAVYQPNSSLAKQTAERLLAEERVHLVAPADYREGKEIDKNTKLIIDKVAADTAIQRAMLRSRKALGDNSQGGTPTHSASIPTDIVAADVTHSASEEETVRSEGTSIRPHEENQGA